MPFCIAMVSPVKEVFYYVHSTLNSGVLKIDSHFHTNILNVLS